MYRLHALVLLLVCLAAFTPGAFGAVDLVLQNPGGAALGPWPVTTGVPFPKGELRPEDDRVDLEDLNGNALPVQTRVTSTWEDGSIRWLLVDFQPEVTGAAEQVFRLLPRGGNPVNPAVAVKSSEPEPGVHVVNTGAMTFTLRKDRFNFLDRVTLGVGEGGQVILQSRNDSGLYVVDGAGTVFRAQAAPPEALVREEHGPLRMVFRAEGWFVSETGEQFCRYLVRIHAFAGQAYLKTMLTLVVTESTGAARFRDIGLTLPIDSASVTFGGAPEPRGLAAGDEAYLLQYDADKFVVRTGEDAREWREDSDGTRAPGWVTATGAAGCLSVGVRDFWQQFPKELSVSDRGLTFHVWPAHGVAKPDREINDAMLQYLWFCHEGDVLDFTVPEAYWNHHGAYSEDQYRYIRSSRKANVLGLAKTHELLLWFHAPEQSAAAQAALEAWQEPPTCLARPEWMCASGAFGRIHPRDPEQFPEIEDALSRAFDCERRLEQHTNDYGMFNYGDGHTVWDKGNNRWSDHYRQWRALHHGAPRVAWLLYIRSGDAKYLRHAIRNTRHVMDIDVCHYTVPEVEALPYPEGKIVGALNDYKGMVHWHAGSRLRDYNAMTDYLLYYWYLTGDRRGLDVAEEWGTSMKEKFEKAQGSREGAGVCAALLELYQGTGDAEYYRIAKLYVDHMTGFSQNMRGGRTYSGHVCSYWPEKRGVVVPYGAFAEWENYAPWLQRYYDLTGDAAVEPNIVAWASAYVDGGFGDLCSLWGADEYVNILAYAYHVSGDVKYLEHGLRLVNRYVNSLTDAPGELYDGFPSIGQMSHGAGYMAQRIPYFLEALSEYGGKVTPEPDPAPTP